MDSNRQDTSGQPQTGANFGEQSSSGNGNATPKLDDLIEPMKEKVVEVAEQEKDAGAEQLEVVARAIHRAASELESEMPQIAGYVHQAGQQIEQAASGLRNGNVNDLMSRFEMFARNQPTAVFGGAMVAGFALTRFLKASGQPMRGTDGAYTGDGGYRGTA
jgi:hypothetical protein